MIFQCQVPSLNESMEAQAPSIASNMEGNLKQSDRSATSRKTLADLACVVDSYGTPQYLSNFNKTTQDDFKHYKKGKVGRNMKKMPLEVTCPLLNECRGHFNEFSLNTLGMVACSVGAQLK